MISTAQELLNQYAELPLSEKKKAAAMILKESLDIETPSLDDDDLILNAEEIFLELDKLEEENGKSESR